MADDITLTVRVRDLARGDFANMRRRLNAMDGDVRRLAGSSNLASERANRLSRELRGVSGRLGEMQRTGRMANSEMQFMRRSMGLLGRELRSAMRAGELSREEFDNLNNQLTDTRLGFDRLTRDVERHSAVAHRAHREEQRRQAEAQRAAQQAARAQREEEQRIQRRGQLMARAQREDEQRAARVVRQQQQAARQAAAAMRQSVGRLAGAGNDDLSARFRSMNDGNAARMAQGFNRLSSSLVGVSGSSERARRNVRALNDDLSVMSRVLQDAQRSGNLSQRDFNALAGGLRLVARGARDLRGNSDISRAALRGVREETAALQAQLRLLGREGTRFSRLDDHLILIQRRMRATDEDAGRLRRTIGRIGSAEISGLRVFHRGLTLLGHGLRNAKDRFSKLSHGMKMFALILALIGPLAASVGAILTTALGAGFIALGAFALRADAQVRTAFGNMKKAIDETLTAAAEPMRDELVDGMARITQAANNAGPALRKAFSATAPLIENVVEAIIGFGRSAMPGFTASLQNMGPVMEGFRSAMSSLGQGFGQLFDNMTKGAGADGLKRAWELLGSELGHFLSNLGSFIAKMSESETATALLVGIFRAFSGVLHTVEAAFAAVDMIAGPFMAKITDWVTGMTSLKDATKRAASSLELAGKSPKELKKQLEEVNHEIDDLKNAPELPGIGRPKDDPINKALEDAQVRRKAILEALAASEEKNAEAVLKSVGAYRDLLDAMQAVSDLNRNYMDAQAAQQKAVLDAEEGSGKYANALKMNGEQLDLTTKAGIEAYEMLSKIAQATTESTNKAQEANAPWEQIQANWQSGYNDIVSLADGMGLSAAQAKILAEQILGLPPTTTMTVEARTADALNSLDNVIATMKTAPDAKNITVKALTQDAITLLENVGYTVTQLPNGEFSITALTGTAKENIKQVQRLRDALKNKTITMSAIDAISGKARAAYLAVQALHSRTIVLTTEHRNVYTGKGGRGANAGAPAMGGLVARAPRKATGGVVQAVPHGGLMQGPGGPTSDSILAMLPSGPVKISDSEFVIRASSVQKYGTSMLNAINAGRFPKFKKGGPTKAQKAAKERAKKEREARNSAVGELTISHFGKMAGFKTTEFAGDLARPDALADLVGSLNKWRNIIKKATHGGLEKSLLKKLDSAGKALIGWEKKLSKVSKSLEKAKEKLDELKQQAQQTKESVKSGVLGATNITGAAQGDAPLTVAGLMARQRQSVDKAGAFSKALKDLQARGVSKTIIQQIAEAGIEGGGLETAGALLSASGSELASINAMQKQIDAFAAGAGNTAADALYGAGIKAAEGLVKGLTKQKKAIEKAMMDIAKAMEKAIKKALGIKSPSKVMEKVGEYTAQGFQAGVEKTHKTTSGWDSMLNVSRTGGTGGVHYGNGAQTIQIMIGNKVVDELILDSNRRTVRARGGNVQAIFNQKR